MREPTYDGAEAYDAMKAHFRSTERHAKRMAATKRGTTHAAAGQKPSKLHERVAEQNAVECSCGYVGPLDGVKWWAILGRWIGTCPECCHSPTFKVPLSSFFDTGRV